MTSWCDPQRLEPDSMPLALLAAALPCRIEHPGMMPGQWNACDCACIAVNTRSTAGSCSMTRHPWSLWRRWLSGSVRMARSVRGFRSRQSLLQQTPGWYTVLHHRLDDQACAFCGAAGGPEEVCAALSVHGGGGRRRGVQQEHHVGRSQAARHVRRLSLRLAIRAGHPRQDTQVRCARSHQITCGVFKLQAGY